MDEDDLHTASRLRELIAEGELEPKQVGIAKVVIDKGVDALSEKQRFVFDRDIAPLLDDEETIDEAYDRVMANPHS